MPELGVATAAQIHLGLSATNIHHDCDTCGSLYFVRKPPLRDVFFIHFLADVLLFATDP